MFLTFKPLLEQKEEEKIFDIKYDLIIDHWSSSSTYMLFISLRIQKWWRLSWKFAIVMTIMSHGLLFDAMAVKVKLAKHHSKKLLTFHTSSYVTQFEHCSECVLSKTTRSFPGCINVFLWQQCLFEKHFIIV